MQERAQRPRSAIQQARLLKKWTQAQLAAEIGYSVGYLATVEREPRLLTQPMAERLATALGLPVEELLRGEVHP